MLTRTSEILGDYLEDRNKREERAAKLQEAKILSEILPTLPISVRALVREKIERLVRELL